MNKEDSLLLRLRAYRPRAGRDSLEDFVTEAFAWVLQQCPEVAKAVLDRIYSSLGGEKPADIDIQGLEWQTQLAVGGKRPDMVCDQGEDVLVFEHKVWAGLGDEQLVNYGEAGAAQWSGKNVRLITITAHIGQFSEKADVRLLWQDIYQVISRVTESSGSVLDRYLQFCINDFLTLLEFEGLGPSKPVSIASIRCYRTGKDFESQIADLFKSLESGRWSLPDEYGVYIRKKDGRYGLQFYRTDNEQEWAPGIFAGCMLDGSDHCVTHRSEPLVDFRVILDFGAPLRDKYPGMAAYKAIKAHLARRLEDSEWTFYDHLEDSEVRSPNKWHPLHIERSFVGLIRGTDTLDAQVGRVGETVSEVLGLLQEDGHLRKLMQECDLACSGSQG